MAGGAQQRASFQTGVVLRAVAHRSRQVAVPGRKSAVLLLVLAAGPAFPVRAPAEDNKYTRVLEPALKAFLRQQQIPGLAIAIVEDNKVVYAKGFGRMSLGRGKGPVTPLTVFHMA